MTMSLVKASTVRQFALAARDRLQRAQVESVHHTVLLGIASAIYELNRGAALSAVRSLDSDYAGDIQKSAIDNLRWLVTGMFERVVGVDAEDEMVTAAREIYNAVMQLPVIG
jgi:hypothetical protein